MYVFRLTWFRLDLLSQPSDMYINGTCIPRIVIAPDQIQKILSAVYLVRIQHQKLQYFEFFGRQTDLSSLDVGWAIINISTLSFLGLGVQAPTPEWGAMLSEAKNVLTSNPAQMLVPGIAIVVLVSAFNLMGDAIRDVLDPKEVL